MRLNPNNYKRTLDALRKTILEKANAQCLTESAVYYHIPLLAVLLYAQRPDVLGPSDWLSKGISDVVAFYGYTDVTKWSDEHDPT